MKSCSRTGNKQQALKHQLMCCYFTLPALTDGNGRVQFRKDTYMRDEMILDALNQKKRADSISVIPF
jgi:murein L,D-transpeptidase YcbB/YkuD